MSYCQSPTEFSDCVRETIIVAGCSSHLSYMKVPGELDSMKRVADLKDPTSLLENVQFKHMCKWVHLPGRMKEVFDSD